MKRNLKIGLISIGALVLTLIIYLIIRYETYRDNYGAAIGALRPSHPGEYEDIGGIPSGLGWV
jgi:hypothetical protein